MARTCMAAADNSFLDGMHLHNVQSDLANYLIARDGPDGQKLILKGELLTYTCKETVKPDINADGGRKSCIMDDIDELAGMSKDFHRELQIDQESRNGYVKDAEHYIADASMYV